MTILRKLQLRLAHPSNTMELGVNTRNIVTRYKLSTLPNLKNQSTSQQEVNHNQGLCKVMEPKIIGEIGRSFTITRKRSTRPELQSCLKLVETRTTKNATLEHKLAREDHA